jgi:hypothetical protein
MRRHRKQPSRAPPASAPGARRPPQAAWPQACIGPFRHATRPDPETRVLADSVAAADEYLEDDAGVQPLLECSEPKPRSAGELLNTLRGAAGAAAPDERARPSRRTHREHPDGRAPRHRTADQPDDRERAEQPWLGRRGRRRRQRRRHAYRNRARHRRLRPLVVLYPQGHLLVAGRRESLRDYRARGVIEAAISVQVPGVLADTAVRVLRIGDQRHVLPDERRSRKDGNGGGRRLIRRRRRRWRWRWRRRRR